MLGIYLPAKWCDPLLQGPQTPVLVLLSRSSLGYQFPSTLFGS